MRKRRQTSVVWFLALAFGSAALAQAPQTVVIWIFGSPKIQGIVVDHDGEMMLVRLSKGGTEQIYKRDIARILQKPYGRDVTENYLSDEQMQLRRKKINRAVKVIAVWLVASTALFLGVGFVYFNFIV